MEKKLDFRVQRTYKLLIGALMNLLKEKNFEDITVGELCEKAMIRRATFYKHFGDKYELFTFMIREVQQDFSKNSKKGREGEHPSNFYIGLIEQMLDFLEKNREMVTTIVTSNVSHILLDILAEEIEFQANHKFKKDVDSGLLKGDPEVMAVMFAGALVYISKWCVLQNREIPRERIMGEYSKIMGVFIRENQEDN